MSLSLGLLGALGGGITGGMLRAGGSRALGAAAGAVGGGLGVSHAMKDVINDAANPDGTYNLIKNELQDPRFYSNVGGMLTGKSKEEREAAHKNMDPNEFKDVYGDENLNKDEHKIIWNTLVGKAEGPDYKRFFHSNVEDKAKILSSRAKDVDDAVWRSKEWMKIEGNPEANQHMSLLGYGQKDPFGHGTSIAPSGDPEFLGVKKEDVVRY